MAMGKTIRSAAGAVLAIPLAFSANLASAELAAWNQDRVTKYAEELAQATQDLYDELLRMPRDAKLNAEQYWQARDDVRTLNNSARHLASALGTGSGREETAPTFRRIQTARRDAEEHGRKALIPDAVLAKISPVGAALLKLRPYYQADPTQAQ